MIPRARQRTLTGQTRDVSPQALAPVLAGFFARFTDDAYARQGS